VSSRARLRASDRAWEAHRAGFALASTASDARAAASLAITQGDTVDGQSMTADRVEYNYTVEIPPSTAKKAAPEPMRPIREKVERWNDEVDDADVVSVRSERERAASVISVAASMLDFDDSDGDGDDGWRRAPLGLLGRQRRRPVLAGAVRAVRAEERRADRGGGEGRGTIATTTTGCSEGRASRLELTPSE